MSKKISMKPPPLSNHHGGGRRRGDRQPGHAVGVACGRRAGEPRCAASGHRCVVLLRPQGRLGATLAIEEINAAGGIKSLGGAKIDASAR